MKTIYLMIAIGAIALLVGFGIGLAMNPIDNAMTESKYNDCVKAANYFIDIINTGKNCYNNINLDFNSTIEGIT